MRINGVRLATEIEAMQTLLWPHIDRKMYAFDVSDNYQSPQQAPSTLIFLVCPDGLRVAANCHNVAANGFGIEILDSASQLLVTV